MAGNRLGPRIKVLYESEKPGTYYILEIDANFQLAKLGIGDAAPELYDPDNPPANGMVCPPPKRFKPRGLHVKAVAGKGRKFLVATSAAATAYSSTEPTTFQVDSEAFISTGRRGETQTF